MIATYTLIVALLTVQGSYAKEVELPAAGVPDTVQFWLTPDSQWRIRTYVMDHDIHVYSLGTPKQKKVSVDFAVEHIKKHYADVTASLIILRFNDPTDKKEVRRILTERGLRGSLEVSKDGLAFYNPDNGEYRSKSTPK